MVVYHLLSFEDFEQWYTYLHSWHVCSHTFYQEEQRHSLQGTFVFPRGKTIFWKVEQMTTLGNQDSLNACFNKWCLRVKTRNLHYCAQSMCEKVCLPEATNALHNSFTWMQPNWEGRNLAKDHVWNSAQSCYKLWSASQLRSVCRPTSIQDFCCSMTHSKGFWKSLKRLSSASIKQAEIEPSLPHFQPSSNTLPVITSNCQACPTMHRPEVDLSCLNSSSK